MASVFSGKAGRLASIYQAQQLQQGMDTAKTALDQGYDQAADAYGKAGATLGTLADSYGAGSKLYQDALGVNGRDASDAARAAYQSAPGYQFNLDQGLQALQRTRAVNGTLASGNADADAMKFATGLASQDFNTWLTNLGTLDTKRYGATGAQAGTLGQLGQAALTTGANKANVAYQGNAAIGKAGAEGLMAGQKAAESRFGALMGGLNLFGQAAGAVMGNPGSVSKAFSIFAPSSPDNGEWY